MAETSILSEFCTFNRSLDLVKITFEGVAIIKEWEDVGNCNHKRSQQNGQKLTPFIGHTHL